MAKVAVNQKPTDLGKAVLTTAEKLQLSQNQVDAIVEALNALPENVAASAQSIITSARDFEVAMQKLQSLNEVAEEETPGRRPVQPASRATGSETTARVGRTARRVAGDREGPPSAPIGGDDDEGDEKKDEGEETPSPLRPYIRIAVLALTGLLIAGIAVWMLFFRTPTAPKPLTLGAPAIATAPAPAPFPTVPNPVAQPTHPWFLGDDDQDKMNVLFSPPMNFSEILRVGWWLVNLMVFVVMSHLRAESIERGEPRDFLVVRNGIVALLVLIAFGDAIALKMLAVCRWFDPNNCGGTVPLQIATQVTWGLGIAIAVGMSWAASMGGRFDLSPFGVGAFVTGTIVKQLLTHPIMAMIGTGLQVIGVLLHIVEIFRHRDERWQVSTIVIVAFGLALGVRYLIEAAFWWGLKSIPQAEWSVPFVNAIAFVYRTRAIPAFGLAILAGLGLVASTVGLGRMAAIVPEQYRERIGAVVAEASDSLRHDARIAFLMGAVVWLAIGLV